MKQGLVSILICTYNAEQTIAVTIQSCLDQNYDMIEILIHDDQSQDKTLKIIESFNNKKINILVSGKKLGPYGGLNFLLDYAQGEYIAIQDHDDLWHAEKIQKQIKFLKENSECNGCGTKTLMRYEGDEKGFEYYLGEKTYYTLHPSLMFRNQGYRYTTNSDYMADALFQKMTLCSEKKLIHNINETLTLHRVKSGAKNYSYQWFKFNEKNIQTIFYLHPWWYACLALGWEGIRKLLYPLLQKIGKGNWIDSIERFPFVLQGYKIKNFVIERVEEMGFLN